MEHMLFAEFQLPERRQYITSIQPDAEYDNAMAEKSRLDFALEAAGAPLDVADECRVYSEMYPDPNDTGTWGVLDANLDQVVGVLELLTTEDPVTRMGILNGNRTASAAMTAMDMFPGRFDHFIAESAFLAASQISRMRAQYNPTIEAPRSAPTEVYDYQKELTADPKIAKAAELFKQIVESGKDYLVDTFIPSTNENSAGPGSRSLSEAQAALDDAFLRSVGPAVKIGQALGVRPVPNDSEKMGHITKDGARRRNFSRLMTLSVEADLN